MDELANDTQFLWNINHLEDPFLDRLPSSTEKRTINSDFKIKGYIASVNKPSDLKIRNTKEKLTIDLFVNGRLREKDILRHFPTSRIVENYVYGQIHYDELDSSDSKDIFTSSREGVISNDPKYEAFLKEIEKLFMTIIEEWDELRRKHGTDGDPDNTRITAKERKAQELFNTAFNEMKSKYKEKDKSEGMSSIVHSWVRQLAEEATYNISSYTECFIAENLLRKYINHNNIELSKEEKSIADKWRNNEDKNKRFANISYQIRTSTDDLCYLDMGDLSTLIDKGKNSDKLSLRRSATIYKPVRDAVGHTAIITPNAQKQLKVEVDNIKARVMDLMDEIE